MKPDVETKVNNFKRIYNILLLIQKFNVIRASFISIRNELSVELGDIGERVLTDKISFVAFNLMKLIDKEQLPSEKSKKLQEQESEANRQYLEMVDLFLEKMINEKTP